MREGFVAQYRQMTLLVVLREPIGEGFQGICTLCLEKLDHVKDGQGLRLERDRTPQPPPLLFYAHLRLISQIRADLYQVPLCDKRRIFLQ